MVYNRQKTYDFQVEVLSVSEQFVWVSSLLNICIQKISVLRTQNHCIPFLIISHASQINFCFLPLCKCTAKLPHMHVSKDKYVLNFLKP